MKKLFVVYALLLMTGCVYYPYYYGDYAYPDTRYYYSYPYGYVHPNVNLYFSSGYYGHSHHYYRHGPAFYGKSWPYGVRHGGGWRH